jgi:hypothetical protein
MTYKQIRNIHSGEVQDQQIERVGDGAIIPFDPANTDYQEYLKWLEEGNAPIGADTPIPSDSVSDDNN